MYYENQSDDWVTIEEAAARLDMTPHHVRQLVEEHVLKARWDGGYLLVQPALVPGRTT